MATGNELRLFVSSTFKDMHEEREHLVKKIFPEIRALCRDRGITFTEVDLRWGLTEEHAVLGQVIRTCLQEIERCRPYFFGITGERYGYIPDLVEIHKDGELLKQYPWIEDAAMDEASILDLEFRHAALNDPTSASGCRFFFRRHRRGFEDELESGSDTERLNELKKRVRDAGLPVEEFRDPVSLGEMVYDELVEIIKRDFKDARPPSPLDQERSRHESFAASRRHAYIPNVTYLKRLNDFVVDLGSDVTADEEEQPQDAAMVAAAGEHNPLDYDARMAAAGRRALIIYAESGSGKSSLVSYWCEQFRRKRPEVHVIEHYVGIGAGSTDHYAIMRHFMGEIKERFERDEEIPSTPEEIEHQFANWLGFGRSAPIILVIDGVNQLTGAALNLTWLPHFIPANMRLIITSTVEQTLLQLRGRGWQQLGMQPLTEKEREAIVVRFLSDYHKALSTEQVRRIAEDQKCSHPLFLRTLLEELRLFGQHERLEAEITRYLETTGTEDLFQVVLERIEEDFGARGVREVMSLLWAARAGLNEIELQELTGTSRLKLSSLLMSLDYHLVQREGIFTFFHDYLRRAVEKRYLAEDDRKRSKHLELADYFEKQVETLIGARG